MIAPMAVVVGRTEPKAHRRLPPTTRTGSREWEERARTVEPMALLFGAMRTALADLSAWLDGVDLGDLPTWLGAGGAIGSMCVTIAALIYAKRAAEATRGMLNVEADRDRKRDDADARAQAEQVSGWYGFNENHPRSSIADGGGDYWGAFIQNASPLPIYELGIEFFYRGSDGAVAGPRSSLKAGTLAPTSSPGFAQAPLDMLRNVEERDVYAVALTFRDSAGRRWRREHDGVLSELA
jgi:hypothetical protein